MRIIEYTELDSTNEQAKRLLRSQRREGTGDDSFIVTADRQSAGKGQRGHSFFSPPGSGLYMSVCLARGMTAGGGLVTRAAALAVCRCVERLHGIELWIKPVNDIIYRGRKAGGILVESLASYGEERGGVIIGIGLNLCRPDGGFPSDIRERAGYIFDAPIDKKELALNIASELSEMSLDFGAEEILREYIDRISNPKEYGYE